MVVDGSDSMTPSWDVLRLTLRELINRLTVQRNSPTTISVVQFGTQAQVVQEFTANINEVNQKIVEMQQAKGCTNTPAALQRTNALFNVQNLPHRKVVFVLTDGGSTEGDPSAEAVKLRESGANIICIGIGKGSKENEVLNIASSINHAFFVKDLNELRQLFVKDASTNGLNEPKLEKFRVRVSKAEVLLQFNNPGVVSATLEKHDGNQWTQVHTRQIPNSTDVSTRLVATKLEENEEYDLRAIVELEGGHKVKSNVITIKTRKANVRGKLLSNREELLKMNEKYTKEIIDFCSDLKQDVSIGLVGKVGNGKSAAVNSIWSVFNGKFQIQSKLGYMGEKSMTSRPLRIPIPKTKIEVVDFFGWDNPEQYESDLRYLIEGLAPDDFGDGHALRPGFKPVLEGADKRKFYGVFILVSPAEVAQVNYLAYVQVLCDFVTRQGLQPIILLTKCDQIDTELVDHPEYVYDSDLVDNYITMLEEKKFPRGFIYPVASYYEPPEGGELDPVRNYLFLSALHTLLDCNVAHSLSHLRITANANNQRRDSRSTSIPTTSSNLPAAQLPATNLPGMQKSISLVESKEASQLVDSIASHDSDNTKNTEIIERQNSVTIKVRQNTDQAFRRITLQDKHFDLLIETIGRKFKVKSTSNIFRVYELDTNGDKIDLEDDDDLDQLTNGAIIIFELEQITPQ